MSPWSFFFSGNPSTPISCASGYISLYAFKNRWCYVSTIRSEGKTNLVIRRNKILDLSDFVECRFCSFIRLRGRYKENVSVRQPYSGGPSTNFEKIRTKKWTRKGPNRVSDLSYFCVHRLVRHSFSGSSD